MRHTEAIFAELKAAALGPGGKTPEARAFRESVERELMARWNEGERSILDSDYQQIIERATSKAASLPPPKRRRLATSALAAPAATWPSASPRPIVRRTEVTRDAKGLIISTMTTETTE